LSFCPSRLTSISPHSRTDSRLIIPNSKKKKTQQAKKTEQKPPKQRTTTTMSTMSSLFGGLKIKVPKWDGKKKGYPLWRQRFMPFAAYGIVFHRLSNQGAKQLYQKRKRSNILDKTETSMTQQEKECLPKHHPRSKGKLMFD
jgi:hypothetical protein